MTTGIEARFAAKFGHIIPQDYLDSLYQGPPAAAQIALRALDWQGVAAAPLPITSGSVQEPNPTAKTEAIAAKTFIQARIREALCRQPYQFSSNAPNLFRESQEIVTDLCKLFVCDCYKLTANARIRLEESVLALIERFYPHKNHLFTIVSVGAGALYQELVYIAKLNRAGYNNVHLIAIDRDPMPVKELQHFHTSYLPTAQLKITPFRSVEKYVEAASTSETSLKPNLLLLLDIIHFLAHGKPFLQHAQDCLREGKILEPNTVIAYSDMQRQNHRMAPHTTCGLYGEGGAELLHAEHFFDPP